MTPVHHYAGLLLDDPEWPAELGAVTFAPGVAQVVVPFTPALDGLAEGDETVVVELLEMEGDGYQVGAPSAATAAIADAAPQAVQATSAGSLAHEDGQADGLVALTRQGDVSQALAVYFAVGGTAAAGVDYEAPWGAETGGAVVMEAWHSTAELVVEALPNEPGEGDETVELALAAAPYAPEEGYLIEEPDIAVAFVRVAQPAARPLQVYFLEEKSQGLESTANPGIVVMLSRVPTAQVTVEYKVKAMPAAEEAKYKATGGGTDFTLANGTLTFPVGVPFQYIPGLTVVNGNDQEYNEMFRIELSNPTGAALGTNTTHTYTIVDKEGALINAKQPWGRTTRRPTCSRRCSASWCRG